MNRGGYEPEEFEVTDAMVAAGVTALLESGLVDDPLEVDKSLVAQIYRAMRGKERSSACANHAEG